MPAELAAFAANSENHDLQSPNSVHDSWLQHWNVREIADEPRRRRKSIQIDMRLLGSRRDRYIHLTYKGVESHSINNIKPSGSTAHGDLLVHEVTFVREGLFAHELLF